MANWLKSERMGRSDTLSKSPVSLELEGKINHLQKAWFHWRYPMILFTLFVFALGVTHSTIEGNWQKLFESPKNIVTSLTNHYGHRIGLLLSLKHTPFARSQNISILLALQHG